MSQLLPFFLSFPQFLAAPREGRLLDELRRLPKRPLTADEVSATAKTDEATQALFQAGIGYMTDRPGDAIYLKGTKRRLWDRYQKSWEAWTALQRAMRESQQRWIYDQAVKAGVIIVPQVVPDPRGDLEKEEKKDERAKEREAQKEADKLLPESSVDWVYHNCSPEVADLILKDGMDAGSFATKPIDFGRKAWVAIRQYDIGPFDSHSYGMVTAIEPCWDKIGTLQPSKFVRSSKRGVSESTFDQTFSPGGLDIYKGVDEIGDAAVDYIENAVGRFYFRQHWAKHRDPEKLKQWLEEFGYDVDPSDVLTELDRFAESGFWRS